MSQPEAINAPEFERANSVSQSSSEGEGVGGGLSPDSPALSVSSVASVASAACECNHSNTEVITTTEAVTEPENAFKPSKMADGKYVFFIEGAMLIGKILSYMYNTIEKVSVVHPENKIEFSVKRSTHKYDPKDYGYAQLSFGTYKYTFEGQQFIVEYTEDNTIVGTHDAPEKYRCLRVYTSSCILFDNFIKLASNYNDDLEVDETKLHIYIANKYGDWIRYNKIPSRKLKTIYFDEKIKHKFRDDITNFLSKEKEKEYEEFGIPYKKNYLLTGIPGSGKTSLIKALCKEIGYHLCIFSINHDVDNHTALCAFRDIPPKSILLIEDIDCLFEKRTGTQENKHFTFSNLINLLDGVLSRQGLVTFITTNHPENMDHALLRQGRIDMIIHMNYPKKVDIRNLFHDILRKSYPVLTELDANFDAFYAHIHKKTITMAGIVAFLFRYKKEWSANIGELLDTDKFIKEVTRNMEESKLYA